MTSRVFEKCMFCVIVVKCCGVFEGRLSNKLLNVSVRRRKSEGDCGQISLFYIDFIGFPAECLWCM